MTVTINGNGTITPTSAVNPTGSILQVLSTTKSDTTSTSSTSFADIGLSQAITPSATSSKILISYDVYIGQTHSETSFINIVRGSTTIAQPSTSANYPATTLRYIGNPSSVQIMSTHNMRYLDSPSTTSAITYKLQWRVDSNTIYLNRYNANDNYHGISSLTLMEIAG